MKIAINAWAFPKNYSIPQGMRIAKRAGFDGVELNISEDEYLTPDMSDSEIGKFLELAHNISLELFTVSSGLWWNYPLTSPDKKTAEHGMYLVRRGLHIARLLGAETLLVVPGLVTTEVSYDEAYERAIAALKTLAEDAERESVKIGVENVWNKFLLSPLEARDFIDAIDSPFVRFYLDIGNLLAYGYPEQWVKILGSRIAAVHVKDFQTNIGNWNGFTNPMLGDVNWKAVRDALREINYKGVITAEIPGYKTLPDLGIRHVGESLKRIFKGTAAARRDSI